ncbi:ABC1 kinase family protein [Skeletonema marinoi]|uniref:ABC1 kinase family protein n=1 Tax=Skeletonema marinoi TaxID=267567 RepID=A0AAD8YDR5_9STRA|nr:ABC1 kinase family protein [Skeletonema marinoi]
MLQIIPPLALTALTLQLTTTYEQRYQCYTKAVANGERIIRAATFSLTIASIIRSYKRKSIELFFRNVVCCANKLTEEEEKLAWNEQHAQGADTLTKTITSMQGFYVKAAQIVASRPDSIPQEYADALSVFTDDNDPLPKELLDQRGEQFDDVFEEFDEAPLGSASIAQVHRAVLSKKYGHREVAVKVQRPSIEEKLMGDIANLKQVAKVFRGADLPVDYYAQESARHGLLEGVPLSRASDMMKSKGIAPDGVEAKLFARKLLKSLTTAFGWSILESGFFHADAHPGNIFVLDDGRIGLIDFGQVKQVDGTTRKSDDNDDDLHRIGNSTEGLDIELKDDAPAHGHAAIAMWLFDGSVETFPDGYDENEMSPNSPVKAMKEFPSDLVLLARSTVLVKGLARRFGVRWSLSQEWAPIARRVLNKGTDVTTKDTEEQKGQCKPHRAKQQLKAWSEQKAKTIVTHLPPPMKKKALSAVLKHQQKRDAKKQKVRG